MPERKSLIHHPNLNDIRTEIEKRGFRFKRKLGQNFLLNRNLLDYITSAGGANPDDLVLEIGGGPGCLTRALLDTGATVIGVEIDPQLYEIGKALILKEAPRKHKGKLVWLNADFLKKKNQINPEIEDLVLKILNDGPRKQLKVIANLPYCIATPAIMNLIESALPWKVMVFMVQDEVADRIIAGPGKAAYGQVSVLTSIKTDAKRIRKVNAGAFWPKPDVESAIVKIVPKKDLLIEDFDAYLKVKKFTKAIFAHRRKTWLKSLKLSFRSLDFDDFLTRIKNQEIRTDLRAQQLAPTDIIRIASFFI